MKKLRLLIASVVLMSVSVPVIAQSFTLDKDTSKGWWVSGGYPVQLKTKVTNVSSSSIQVDWRISSYVADAGWSLGSACEPSGSCYSGTTTGLKDGSVTFTSGSMTPGYNGNFVVDLEGDPAAFGSKATLVIDVSTGGGAIKKAVFVAYKNTTGISTTILSDNEVAIFPNPASNYIDVTYNSSSDVKTIALYNLIGKVVSVYKVTDKNSARCEFAADMPSGIYLVRIADSNGKVIATKKITHQ